MKDRVFGDAGDVLVIEKRLSGREVSFLLFTDGTDFVGKMFFMHLEYMFHSHPSF
jgi:phosphoribosylamine-glycine ligase